MDLAKIGSTGAVDIKTEKELPDPEMMPPWQGHQQRQR